MILVRLHTSLSLLLLFVLPLIVGCNAYETQSSSVIDILAGENVSLSNQYLVWPPAPQKTRIKYLGSLSNSSAVQAKKSGLGNIVASIFGEEEIASALLRPYGVYASSGAIYVADPGEAVLHIFDIRGRRYFRSKDAGKEEFVSPIGVVSDRIGNIYVSDSVLKRVIVLNKEGKYSREIGSSEMFVRPTGLAVDEERIFVVDTLGHCVLVFKKEDGKILFKFGRNGSAKGEFNYPTNIFVDRNNLIYVMDSLNFRVQIFDRTGMFISSFGKLGDGSGDFSKPKGIAVDSEGHIYVVDALHDNVQIFDRSGNFLLSFGKTGRREGEMTLPSGLFVDEDDRIYISDTYNSRLQIFQYVRENPRNGKVVDIRGNK